MAREKRCFEVGVIYNRRQPSAGVSKEGGRRRRRRGGSKKGKWEMRRLLLISFLPNLQGKSVKYFSAGDLQDERCIYKRQNSFHSQFCTEPYSSKEGGGSKKGKWEMRRLLLISFLPNHQGKSVSFFLLGIFKMRDAKIYNRQNSFHSQFCTEPYFPAENIETYVVPRETMGKKTKPFVTGNGTKLLSSKTLQSMCHLFNWQIFLAKR